MIALVAESVVRFYTNLAKLINLGCTILGSEG